MATIALARARSFLVRAVANLQLTRRATPRHGRRRILHLCQPLVNFSTAYQPLVNGPERRETSRYGGFGDFFSRSVIATSCIVLTAQNSANGD
jgi:hypothetical protein